MTTRGWPCEALSSAAKEAPSRGMMGTPASSSASSCRDAHIHINET
eukprot:COSAG01_NODE_64771_length_275_cov_0.880682_1_plen_45_part_10